MSDVSRSTLAEQSTQPGPGDAPVLSVTQRAFRRVEALLAREGISVGALRLGRKGGGCTGYQYVLKLEAGEPRSGDSVLESGNARIYVDPKSALLLAGTVLDFTDGLNGQGFTFENPNAKRTCGCGHSFSA
jgi:iron-sulfur cluster assembly protein